jgi:FkbM family methyltransferase
MIVDAPLKFPGDRSYRILGETGNTRFLCYILLKLRPDAQFLGFTDDPADREADILIVSDLAVDGAASLIHERDADDVAIFPLPYGDVWAYWAFSAVGLDNIVVGDPLTMSIEHFEGILDRYGRLTKNKETGEKGINGNNYLISDGAYIGRYKDPILEVMAALSDDASRAAYSRVLIGEPDAHWAHYVKRVYQNIQYFDYIDYGRCEVVLNGGVFGGYELPFLVTNLPVGATVHNFDPLGHSHLTEYARPWVESGVINFIDNAFALDEKDGNIEMKVLNDGQVSKENKVNDVEEQEELTTFPARTLDGFVEETGFDRVDLIKFDLEGGDQNAIRGSLETMKKYRPQLALSIYHEAPDFWEIPNMMIDNLPDYNFYLDTYSFERWETIFYGVPKELGSRTSNVQ